MKKTFFVCLFALATAVVSAANPNIYATGVGYQSSGKVMTLQYTLNAPATAVALYQGDNKVADITDVALLAAGKHTTSITLDNDIAKGTRFALKVEAAATTALTEVTDASRGIYSFYLPQGVAVDNNPENQFFGRIYISELEGNTDNDAGSDRTRTQKGGIFIYDALLNELNTPNTGYQNDLVGKTSSSERQNFKRIKVGLDGSVYVNRNVSGSTCIYKFDPADLTAAPTQITDGSLTKINSFCIDGDSVIFVLDNANTDNGGGRIVKIQNGVLTELVQDVTWANQDNDLAADGCGGVWVAQNRGQLDGYSQLTHITANGQKDYFVTADAPADVKSMFVASNRGTLAINQAKNIIAFNISKTVTLFSVSYDETTGVPTLTKVSQTPTLGTNIDGIAFDAVDNLYVMSASSERLYVFCTPKADNSFTTPVVERELEDVVNVESITLNNHEINDLQVSFSESLAANILPANATNKNFSWASGDESIATVDGGVVKAVAPGDVYIYAIAEENAAIKDSCLVHVIAKVLFYPNIYALGMKITPANEDNQFNIEYTLNAPATEVNLILTDANDTETVIALNGKAMGINKETVIINDLAAGIYQWAIEAKAPLASDEEGILVNIYDLPAYACPRGVAVNNNPYSPFFGNVYVTEAAGSVVEGSGLYAYDALLNGGDQLYTKGWSKSAASPMRVTVGQDDDMIYITDWSDDTTNIHIVNPADLTQETLVFGGVRDTASNNGVYMTATGKPIHGSMPSCYVTGKDETRVLYTFDEDIQMRGIKNPKSLLRYDIGKLEKVWDTIPSAVIYDNVDMYQQNGNSVIIPDAFGGWWISQDRSVDSESIPALIHMNANDSIDFNSKGLLGGRTRAGIAFNADQTIMASVANNCIRMFMIAWDESGKPTVTFDYVIATTFGSETSNYCYSLAMDRAENIYASSNGHPLCVFTTIKEENKCTTPGIGTVEIKAPTALRHIGDDQTGNIRKVFERGHIFIIRNGQKFNMIGSEL